MLVRSHTHARSMRMRTYYVVGEPWAVGTGACGGILGQENQQSPWKSGLITGNRTFNTVLPSGPVTSVESCMI